MMSRQATGETVRIYVKKDCQPATTTATPPPPPEKEKEKEKEKVKEVVVEPEMKKKMAEVEESGSETDDSVESENAVGCSKEVRMVIATPIERQPEVVMCPVAGRLLCTWQFSYDDLIADNNKVHWELPLSWAEKCTAGSKMKPKYIAITKMCVLRDQNTSMGPMYLNVSGVRGATTGEGGETCVHAFLDGGIYPTGHLVHCMSQSDQLRLAEIAPAAGYTMEKFEKGVEPREDEHHFVPEGTEMYEILKEHIYASKSKELWTDRKVAGGVLIEHSIYNDVAMKLRSDLKFLDDVLVPADKVRFDLSMPVGTKGTIASAIKERLASYSKDSAALDYHRRRKHIVSVIVDIDAHIIVQ